MLARLLGIGPILWGALIEWQEDKAPRMAAAIAFYTVFSITPIVVIAYQAAAAVFGPEAALQEILSQAATLIGAEGASGIRLLIDHAPARAVSTTATVIGLATMLFAATGVFSELKDSLNTIWEVQAKPGLGILEFARYRVFGFAMVLVIWFLMLVSLLISAALASLAQLAAANAGGMQVVETVVSLLCVTALFALIYRMLPDVVVAWRDVWFGALVAAVLFAAGKALFGMYLGHSTLGVSYGAAGSLVVVILWTYYTSLILLFGAEITRVQARLRHAPLLPNPSAVRLTEHDRVQQGIPRQEAIREALAEQEAAEKLLP
jgi:membrane protein